nr:phenol hydroxylase subunit P4 [uncultured Rhodopila sp.]
MTVTAIVPDYADRIETADAPEKFHGNAVIYVHWEEHLSFCSALAFPLPLAMPFGALVSEVITPYYAAHPDAANIVWDKVVWDIDGGKKAPDFSASLEANGLGHKSLVRFWTPGLNGWAGSAS